MGDNVFNDTIQFISGVGPVRAKLLRDELGVKSIGELLFHFPYRYVDRTVFNKISDIVGTQKTVQLIVKVVSIDLVGRAKAERLTVTVRDGDDTIDLVWFRGAKQIQKRLVVGESYVVFGKPSGFNGRYNIVHPEIEVPSKSNDGMFQAVYHTSERMKKSLVGSSAILKLQKLALDKVKGRVVETLPFWLIDKLSLLTLEEALVNIHTPTTSELLERAIYRFKFEELFYIQLKLILLKQTRSKSFRGHPFKVIGDKFNSFFKDNIPFELTGAQKRVVTEIREDVRSSKQMNRLIQGDVGSGKTMVALMAILMAIDNGYQGTLMAPTEILATQHYISVVKMLDGLDITVRLLTGSTKKRERAEIDEMLQDGSLDILIGTHAILEDHVKYHSLGIVVIDEQHRFGVVQRSKLWKKNFIPPHMLVMTATPIPRTLAMTLYGDLDVSVIDELPPGRKPIETLHMLDSNRDKINAFIKQELDKGRQAYIVYPLISESETLDFKNLEDGYEQTKLYFPEPEYKIGIVHGKLKAEEKELEMQKFKNHETNILVATTVIEVGVDVPNATIMVIESCERFGLSQLHQLRGRVGRGGGDSYCILASKPKLSQNSRKRIEIMVNSTDGFVISEEDLKLRGPGEIDGTVQSGNSISLKVANLAKDGVILQYCKSVAERVLELDPSLKDPSNILLKNELERMKNNYFRWGVIG